MCSIQLFQLDDDAEVMAAIEQTDERVLFILSDISKDDAWLTVPETEAAALDTWQ